MGLQSTRVLWWESKWTGCQLGRTKTFCNCSDLCHCFSTNSRLADGLSPTLGGHAMNWLALSCFPMCMLALICRRGQRRVTVGLQHQGTLMITFNRPRAAHENIYEAPFFLPLPGISRVEDKLTWREGPLLSSSQPVGWLRWPLVCALQWQIALKKQQPST